MNIRPVSFPNWKDVLAQTALSPQVKLAYTREILTFLKHCKTSRAPATTELAKQYLGWREKQSAGPAREALRWFYKEGYQRAKSVQASGVRHVARSAARAEPPGLAGSAPRQAGLRPMQPPPAADDLGTTPWEQPLTQTAG
ncbi:MAG: hypothetical protein HY302_11775 [Opitutae bacterium]|nr:hypothetical protein [Opitutae bacterium]